MSETANSLPEYRYVAAGGVLVHNDRVLVLQRPSREEIRLPKGHVEPDESPREAAIREVIEETGFTGVDVVADLGSQVVEFDFRDRRWIRTERYFLMSALSSEPQASPEEQFTPTWMAWSVALASLTFEAEREWVRRAHRVHLNHRADHGV